MWDETPLDQIERTLAGFMVLPNDEQLLARRSVVARRNIAQAAVADLKPIDNGGASMQLLDFNEIKKLYCAECK